MIIKFLHRLLHKIRNNKLLSVTGWRRIEQKVKEIEVKRLRASQGGTLGFS